jgi:hypothetical protein
MLQCVVLLTPAYWRCETLLLYDTTQMAPGICHTYRVRKISAFALRFIRVQAGVPALQKDTVPYQRYSSSSHHTALLSASFAL